MLLCDQCGKPIEPTADHISWRIGVLGKAHYHTACGPGKLVQLLLAATTRVAERHRLATKATCAVK